MRSHYSYVRCLTTRPSHDEDLNGRDGKEKEHGPISECRECRGGGKQQHHSSVRHLQHPRRRGVILGTLSRCWRHDFGRVPRVVTLTLDRFDRGQLHLPRTILLTGCPGRYTAHVGHAGGCESHPILRRRVHFQLLHLFLSVHPPEMKQYLRHVRPFLRSRLKAPVDHLCQSVLLHVPRVH